MGASVCWAPLVSICVLGFVLRFILRGLAGHRGRAHSLGGSECKGESPQRVVEGDGIRGFPDVGASHDELRQLQVCFCFPRRGRGYIHFISAW